MLDRQVKPEIVSYSIMILSHTTLADPILLQNDNCLTFASCNCCTIPAVVVTATAAAAAAVVVTATSLLLLRSQFYCYTAAADSGEYTSG